MVQSCEGNASYLGNKKNGNPFGAWVAPPKRDHSLKVLQIRYKNKNGLSHFVGGDEERWMGAEEIYIEKMWVSKL